MNIRLITTPTFAKARHLICHPSRTDRIFKNMHHECFDGDASLARLLSQPTQRQFINLDGQLSNGFFRRLGRNVNCNRLLVWHNRVSNFIRRHLMCRSLK